MRKAKSRKVHSRKVIMRVVKYTYNSQITGEGSESTLLVLVFTKSLGKSRKMQLSFEGDNDVS